MKQLSTRQREILAAITHALEAHGYAPSVREIAEIVGLSSPSSVAYHLRILRERGFLSADPSRPRTLVPAERAARPPAQYVPLLGQISAGVPITAEQNVEEILPLPQEITGQGSVFTLRVVGDSMTGAMIADGDWVVVREQSTAENGEIVAALIDGEATVKVWHRSEENAWLLPRNDAYAPIPAQRATIMGRVVSVLRRL